MYGYLLLGVLTVASANTIGNDKCPEPEAVENFDLASFSGLWYEIAYYPTKLEGKGQCGTIRYTLAGDVMKVKASDVLDSVQTSVDGIAQLQPCADNSGRLTVTFKIGDSYPESEVIILATDYNNYAILYSCYYDTRTNSHQENSWIWSRSTVLEGEAKTCVDEYIENSSLLDSCKFIYMNFSKKACRYTSIVNLSE